MRHDAAPAPHELVRRAFDLIDAPRRRVPGRRLLRIAGAPGSGKSTLAGRLVRELAEARPGAVALVGMDGFHLAEAVLRRRGLESVKGAPHTFDVHGYLALLARLRTEDDHPVYAPVFHREIEESIAHEAEVGPAVRLVITEGNYLLLDDGPWAAVRGLLDEAWFLDVPDAVRLPRLVARHRRYGRTDAEAWERSRGSDQANAELVAAGAARADLVITEPLVPAGPAVADGAVTGSAADGPSAPAGHDQLDQPGAGRIGPGPGQP